MLRVEQPGAFGVAQRAAQGLDHALHGLVEFRFRHALARERKAEARREGLDAWQRPARHAFAADQLQGAVHHAADVADGFACPVEFDLGTAFWHG